MITFHDTKIHTFGYDDSVVRKLLCAAERAGHEACHDMAERLIAEHTDGVPPTGILQKMINRVSIPEKGVECVRAERPGFAEHKYGIVWADMKRVLYEYPSLKTIYQKASRGLRKRAHKGALRHRKHQDGYHTLYALPDVAEIVALHRGGEWQSTKIIRENTGRDTIGALPIGVWIYTCRNDGRIRYRKIQGRYLHHIEDVRNEMQKSLMRTGEVSA